MKRRLGERIVDELVRCCTTLLTTGSEKEPRGCKSFAMRRVVDILCVGVGFVGVKGIKELFFGRPVCGRGEAGRLMRKKALGVNFVCKGVVV